MEKKFLLSLFLIIVMLLPVISCSQLQEKPFDATGLPADEVTPYPSTAIAGNTGQTKTEVDAESSLPDLQKLQNFENSFILINSFPQISFERPLEFQDPNDGSGSVFVTEQGGRIFAIDNLEKNTAELFLDISDRVDSGGSEEGLLGLAFHPDFKSNGLFYVNYTSGNNTVVSCLKVTGDNPVLADPGSEEKVLTFKQPYPNHNGGKLSFGPDDGYLYIATGDGGGAGDPQKNGQNLKTLLGKILCIDIDEKDPGLNYSVPPGNPFKDNKEGYMEEIYAYGLRNPWRFSFDSETGKLWAADVGQGYTEEIDIIQKGKNYGWNIMEGSYCYEPASGCNPEGLELPVYEYLHPLGKSITGGYVYRGKNFPMLQGVYVYADFVTGYIWGLAYSEGQAPKNYTLASTGLNISSIGVDQEQELYFTAFDGKIYNLALP